MFAIQYLQMFSGKFPACGFLLVGATCAIVSLFVIYFQSQYYHHQPPFPHQYISKVAQHYPEYFVFRLATISGSVLIVLGWLTNHFLLQTDARQHSIHLRKYHPEIPLVLGITGALMLMGNTATIDTGFMNEHLHQFSARTFFILTFLAQIYNTVLYVMLSKQVTTISTYNLGLKFFVLFLLALQLLDGASADYFRGVDSDKSKFLEWTMTATVISMFISIGLDAYKYEFVYVDVSEAKRPSIVE